MTVSSLIGCIEFHLNFFPLLISYFFFFFLIWESLTDIYSSSAPATPAVAKAATVCFATFEAEWKCIQEKNQQNCTKLDSVIKMDNNVWLQSG